LNGKRLVKFRFNTDQKLPGIRLLRFFAAVFAKRQIVLYRIDKCGPQFINGFPFKGDDIP